MQSANLETKLIKGKLLPLKNLIPKQHTESTSTHLSLQIRLKNAGKSPQNRDVSPYDCTPKQF